MTLDDPQTTEPGDDDGPDDQTPARRRRGGSASVLGAAMLAMGDIIEPEKTRVEIVQTDDQPLDDLPFTLDFGDLPPLD